MIDQLAALPQSQLELAEVALDSLFALRHGAEQGFEGVAFSFEGLLVVFEAASRKESSQALRRCGLLRFRLRHHHLDLLRRRVGCTRLRRLRAALAVPHKHGRGQHRNEQAATKREPNREAGAGIRIYGVTYSPFDVGPPRRAPWRRSRLGSLLWST